MPKRKGNKLPKGARQNRREKILARKQDIVPASETDITEDAVGIAEQADAAAAETSSALEAPAAENAVKPAEAAKTGAPVERKRPGRKPMTEEQKAEARKKREALKAAGAKTTVYIQYRGMEDGVDDLVEAARADYRIAHKRKRINSIKIYVKPEEYTAYYVVNDTYFGKVDM